MVKSLVTVCQSGETACFVCENKSLEIILRLKRIMEKPFLDFAKVGTPISFLDSAALEQSNEIAFSVTFNEDDNSIDYIDDNGYALLPGV